MFSITKFFGKVNKLMERKFLITSIFITLGAIAFLSGYLLMPQTDLRPTTHNQQHLTKQVGSLIDRFNNKVEVGSSKGKIPNTLPLSSRKFITFVQPFTDSKKVVAIANNGDFVEIDLVNLIEKMVYTDQTGIVEAILSPSGNSVIYSFYDVKNNKKWVYLNLKSGESTEIEGNLRSAAFSPDGSQAAYLISRSLASGNEGELLIAKDGKIIKRTLKTRIGAAILSWPSDNFMSMIAYDKSGYGDLFTLKGVGVLDKIISYQYDLNVKWSPAGERVIFSAKDDNGFTQLLYKDIENSGTAVALDVDTNTSKCVWANEEEIICGLKNQTQIKDEFYKINLTGDSKTLVATPDINLLTKELALSRSGDALFVLNDIDGKLYVLKIK
ncbi:MAG: hypothetical protein A3J47_03325 [Candidatus Yanofskybacteria bacterium RIFCSPHIGHO2_02_FULL_43_22]|uniref:Dipeptidylpeptidase IV N-terminal domain-containing protein n=1 Tax=Candidatus Yanofskybacteria bacterium RIFCSPHIGHO2_02_FULL_43_22 TaxID=1802681 RepID=A0A1F8FUW4_9BACT|nr:MAG: hypothetical protein A3J47_03325 [Candidatus Yanofskybacteria bacterium RIFCSPHIGHO2_02_FULL_43_22]